MFFCLAADASLLFEAGEVCLHFLRETRVSEPGWCRVMREYSGMMLLLDLSNQNVGELTEGNWMQVQHRSLLFKILVMSDLLIAA